MVQSELFIKAPLAVVCLCVGGCVSTEGAEVDLFPSFRMMDVVLFLHDVAIYAIFVSGDWSFGTAHVAKFKLCCVQTMRALVVECVRAVVLAAEAVCL